MQRSIDLFISRLAERIRKSEGKSIDFKVVHDT